MNLNIITTIRGIYIAHPPSIGGGVPQEEYDPDRFPEYQDYLYSEVILQYSSTSSEYKLESYGSDG